MLKEEIISGCVKTSLSLDVAAINDEIMSSDIVFNSPGESKRGPTHQHVEDIFLRGGVKTYHFEGGLEPENQHNNPELEKLPSVKHFLESMPGVIGRAALLSLEGNSVISIHRDSDHHGYFKNTLRFHAPLVTYDEVRFFNEGKFYHMKEGEVWVINNLGRHGVINENPERRLHLVFDVYINDELAKLAFEGNKSLGKPASENPELLSRLRSSTQQRLSKEAAQSKKENINTRQQAVSGYDHHDELRDMARLIELQNEQTLILKRLSAWREKDK